MAESTRSYTACNSKTRWPVSIRSRFERRIERLWYGESVAAVLLVPLAWLYGGVVALRRLAYRAGWLSSVASPVPVVVVGNVTVGGAGKTPLVAWLVQRLAQAGWKPGIVSRGYGRRAGGHPVLVAVDDTAEAVGDEPLLLARRTGVPVCIGADRVMAIAHLLHAADIDIIIADDGLQHYRMRRDLEFAVVDGARGLGNGRLLPAGPLREPAARLREVDRVFVNGGSDAGLGGPAACGFELRPERARSLVDAAERELAAFRGCTVWAVAGIGNPDRFYAMLAERGIEADPVPVSDHGVVSLEVLSARRAQPILMTEKDAVKYPAPVTVDAWYVPVELHMTHDAEAMVEKQIAEIRR